MLTSHCQFCGAPKAQAQWANDYCAECETVRSETRAAVSMENDKRVAANAKVLTPEVKSQLQQAAERDYTGELARQLSRDLGLQPIIDMSAALREALAKRAHTTNSGHTDPRAVFNPGFADARAGNLGMDAKIPPGTVTRSA